MGSGFSVRSVGGVVAGAGAALLLVLLLVRAQQSAVSEGADPPSGLSPPALVDPTSVYDPVAAGERLPAGYRRVVGRDAIRPIYAPQFVPAADAGWPDETLVLGVALRGEAHAYPVSVLNFREMVLDRLGGIPILSSW